MKYLVGSIIIALASLRRLGDALTGWHEMDKRNMKGRAK